MTEDAYPRFDQMRSHQRASSVDRRRIDQMGCYGSTNLTHAVGNMDIERITQEYAGDDYAKPAIIEVACVDLFDAGFATLDELIALLNDFKTEHSGRLIVCNFGGDAYDEGVKAELSAYRPETPEETAMRIIAIRQRALHHYEANRQTALVYQRKYLSDQQT